MALSKETHNLLKKSLLILLVCLSLACFSLSQLLDSYYLVNRPRQPQPAEGRIYSKYIKVSYGATVYLTKREHFLSSWLFPVFPVFIVIGYLLNMRWKLFAPYKKERWELPTVTKRKAKVK